MENILDMITTNPSENVVIHHIRLMNKEYYHIKYVM